MKIIEPPARPRRGCSHMLRSPSAHPIGTLGQCTACGRWFVNYVDAHGYSQWVRVGWWNFRLRRRIALVNGR